MITSKTLSRRNLLLGALSAGVVGVAGCSGSSDDKDEASGQSPSAAGDQSAGGSGSSAPSKAAGASSLLPTYTPYTGVKPDQPSTSDLVLPAFYDYPAQPVQFVAQPPISGGSVSVLTNTNVGTPPPLDKNKYWQALNQNAGAAIDYTMVPEADYLQKFQTSIAGGDLPEIVSIRSTAGLPDLLKKEFTDLSRWLAGDAAKKYPALANIPTIAWRSSVYAGGLYTIPIPRPATSGEMGIHLDLVQKLGGDIDVKSYTDFVNLCKSLTDSSQHRWALAGPPATLNFVREMTGNANIWRNADGKFTYYGEEDSFKQALSSVASMWKQGLFHPDSFASPGSAVSWMQGDIICMYNGSQTYGYYNTMPGSEWTVIVPPKYDGGGDGTKYYGTAQYGNGIALRKNDESRIEQLLGLMNWLASPFGTKEYLFLMYGVEGVDYTMANGAPTPTQTGLNEVTLPVKYTGAPAYVNYAAGHTNYTKLYYEWQTRCAKIAVLSPTLGLYSATDQSKGATLNKTLTDLQAEIIQGRKSLDDWDSAMKSWASGGGNTIRDEYQKAYAASQ